MLEPLLSPPTPQPRLSLLNGHEEPLYENLLSFRKPQEEEETSEEMASSSSSSNSRLTGIPVLLKRSQPQSSFLHSTYRPTSAYRPPLDNHSKVSSTKRNTTCIARPSRTRPNGSVDSDSSSSRCSSDSLVINQDKQDIPPQMVATLAGQFNALIERRKAQQQHLQQVDSRLNFQKKPVEVKKTVRSCPSSPQPVASFTRGKWGSVGHQGSGKCRGGTVMTPDRPPFTSSTESCDSTTLDQRSPLTDEVKLTAVQRAARNYEVALKKTTSSSFSALSTTTTTKVTKVSVDSWKVRPTVKPPEVPPTPPQQQKQKQPMPPEPVKDEQQSMSMDLLAEIDRHLKSKESVVLTGNSKEPNPSFLWKNTTQKRFEKVEQDDVNVDDNDDDEEEEHLYEELTTFFSSRKNERLDVPLAMPENDSSSSSSSYGYAAASLSYSVARCSFKSNTSSTNKETLTEADAESDGGSWADDSDDEGQQWCQTKPSRRTWSKNVRDETKGSRSEVQSGGEGLWEDDGGAAENIYNEPLTEAEVVRAGGGGGSGGKKVKRNWSWSKTRTEFHLDISSKLGRIRPTNNTKKGQNQQVNKWPFKGGDLNKVNRKWSPTEKEASAQFYIPSSSSSSESKVNLESVGRRAKRLSNAGNISRPTTAPPLPPVLSGGELKASAKEDDDSSSTGISSRSCESVSLAKDHEEEEPKRFLYLDDTYYIDEDHKKLSPFDNEPLYQFYTMAAQQRAAHENQVDSSDDDCYESLYQVTAVVEDDGSTDVKASDDDQAETKMSNVPSAMELVRLTEGGVRTLWCEVPEVVASGVLNTITVPQRNVQEAMFEVITSEASYLKSLNILINHFMMCPMFLHEFSSDCVLSKRERHVLFSDVVPVRETSERLLEALERRWQESIVIKDICDILLVHATKYFDVYVKYCSNQLYQDRCLKKLKESNGEFVEVLRRLESNSMCQGLSMYSFLLLPMQRITRLPLLVDAIFHRLGTDSPNYDTCKQALATLNKIVHECNEGAQRMARMEEMLNISRQLDFRMFKGLALISASRWLVKQGELVRLLLGDSCKLSFVRNRCPKQVVHLFLFTDILIVTKKKSDDCYHVVDYCPRNMLQVTEGPDQLPDRLLPDGCRNLFQLTMLQNHDGKTVEMFFTCPMESDRTRWVEAIAPKRSDDPDERIYEEWDCPQVQAIHNYTAQQPDELSLEESDVVNVFRKMADGWYQGERIRDGSTGWFPSNYTLEIVSSHVRARNLRQRYRLLALSQSYLEEQRKKEAKI